MNKITLILKREYLTRVKKKTFLIMTILGPILMAGLIIMPAYISQMSDETKTIAVADDTGLFYKRFPDSENLKFVYLNDKIGSAKETFVKAGYYALLYIPVDTSDAVIPTSFTLFSEKQPSMIIKAYLENVLKKDIESMKLSKSGISEEVLASIKTPINITTIKLKSTGGEEKSYSEMSTIVGLLAGIMIYIFIFMYGALVMRGVIEEKSNRIVEVIVSSVKPFQLMMGKITGVALVGLTQFLLWVLLFTGILITFRVAMPDTFNSNKTEQLMIGGSKIPNASEITSTVKAQPTTMDEVMEAAGSINISVMLLSFLFYFTGGYLLYAALFAAIGAAVDNEADTQQFMLPVTIPLLFAVIMVQFVINNPEGPVAFWLSMIPLTSPVIMMVRIPFGVPYWEIALSAILLVIAFIGATWLAAKIYRTGILMYGKKVTYRELWKWLRYNN
jgi:ABC-2 type transport system permease protein